jgi:hypothetical protein
MSEYGFEVDWCRTESCRFELVAAFRIAYVFVLVRSGQKMSESIDIAAADGHKLDHSGKIPSSAMG